MVLATRRDRLRFATGIKTTELYPGQPAADGDHRRRRAAEQGDRRRATPSRTRPASTRTASSRSARPTRSSTPKTVGVPESKLVLGKHSGRHALRARCEELGITLDKAELDELYTRFVGAGRPQEGHPG